MRKPQRLPNTPSKFILLMLKYIMTITRVCDRNILDKSPPTLSSTECAVNSSGPSVTYKCIAKLKFCPNPLDAFGKIETTMCEKRSFGSFGAAIWIWIGCKCSVCVSVFRVAISMPGAAGIEQLNWKFNRFGFCARFRAFDMFIYFMNRLW